MQHHRSFKHFAPQHSETGVMPSSFSPALQWWREKSDNFLTSDSTMQLLSAHYWQLTFCETRTHTFSSSFRCLPPWILPVALAHPNRHAWSAVRHNWQSIRIQSRIGFEVSRIVSQGLFSSKLDFIDRPVPSFIFRYHLLDVSFVVTVGRGIFFGLKS